MKSLLSSAFVFTLATLTACGEEQAPPIDPPAPVMVQHDAAPVVVSKVDKIEPPPIAPPVADKPVVATVKPIVPKTADEYIEVARGHIEKNERQAALVAARKAVKLAPASSRAYNTLGRAELLRHSYEAAIEAFGKATELDANNVWAWNNLGYVYLTLERYSEAASALREATSRPGTTGYMFNNLGTAYEHLDELDAAREAYEHGGALGSVAAAKSRERLEGVETIAVVSWPKHPDTKATPTEYDLREEASDDVPEPMAPSDEVESIDDPVVDQTQLGAMPIG